MPMATPAWTKIAENIRIEANPASGLWTNVCEYLGPKRLIKIEANKTSTWKYGEGKPCGADGDLDGDGAELMVQTAPLGALIGKMGGSTAVNETENPLFVVGSLIVMRLKDTQEGPLYLTINDSPKGLADNSDGIQVNVYQ